MTTLTKSIAKTLINEQGTEIIIPSSYTSIGASAFKGQGITNVYIPNSVTSIKRGAFSNNLLTSVNIPKSVTSIGAATFAKNQLTSVEIPINVNLIGSSAFRKNKIRSITIPEGVELINKRAFQYNELSRISLPKSLIAISKNAFAANRLESIDMPINVARVSASAFHRNDLEQVQVSKYHDTSWIPEDVRIVRQDNKKPNRIELTQTKIYENNPEDNAVSRITTNDEFGDSHTYALATGKGDEDNSLFSVVGDLLFMNESADYESKSSYKIRLKTTDQEGLRHRESFVIEVNDVNEPPFNLSLSSTTFSENIRKGSTVARINASDYDSNNEQTYKMVRGNGDADNSSFKIRGNQLRIKALPDFETKNSYSILLQAKDVGGLKTRQNFTLNVEDIENEVRAKDFDSQLVIPEDYVAEGFSFGEIYSELVYTNYYPNHRFDAKNFEIEYINIKGYGLDKNISAKEAGISLDQNGMIMIDTTFEPYQYLLPGEEADASVNFIVRDYKGYTDQGVVYFKVDGVNDSPTGISVSQSSFDEGIKNQSVVAVLSSKDLDSNDSHAYSFTNKSGEYDNSEFIIDGNQLKIIDSPDYETKSSYTLNIKTQDAGGLTHRQDIVLTVNDLVEDNDDDNDGFVDSSSTYQIRTESGIGVDLTNKKGRKYSDASSELWNAKKAVQTESGFMILIIHERKNETYKVWSAGSDGAVTSMSNWTSGNQMMNDGFEDLFDLDLNDDSIIGKPPTQDLDGDGFVDGATEYQVFTTDARELYLRNKNGRKIFSDDTSRQWDAIRLITADSSIQTLIEGTARKDGKFKVWTSDLTSGNLISQTRWLKEDMMISDGYESLFNYDINDNGVIGA